MTTTTTKQRRPRGSGRIFKPKTSPYLWVQYYDGNGKPRRMSSKSADPLVAERLLRKKIGEVEAGVSPDHRGLRYKDVRRSYLLERMTGKKSKSLPRKPNGSLALGDDGLPVFSPVTRLDSFFEGVRVKSITTDLVNEFIVDQRGKGYKGGTINRSLTCLRRMLRIAQRDGKLRHVCYFPMQEEAAARSGFFDVAEFRALLSVLPPHLRAVLGIGFWCGVRIGEIRSIRWSQVDFLERTIALTKTKNNEPRVVPLSAELLALLEAHRKACPIGFEYLAYQPTEKGVERLTTFVRTWRRCTKLAGLKGKLFHDLRRSCIRHMTRAGISQDTAMRISGHKTANVFRRYNIVDQNDLRIAAKQLESYIAEVGAKTGQNAEPAEEKPTLTQ